MATTDFKFIVKKAAGVPISGALTTGELGYNTSLKKLYVGNTSAIASGISMDGLVHIVSTGSVGAPGLTFTGDLNTGIFSPGADLLAFVTNGTERVRILADGKVGIGTSTPSSPLEISGTGNQDLRVTSTNGSDVSLTFVRATDAIFDSRIRNTGGNVLFERSANDGTSWTTNMFLGGNTTYNTRIGIGTEMPQRRLSIVTTSNDDGIQIRRNSDTANSYASLSFRTNTTEAATNYGEIRSIRTNRAVGGDSDLALYAFTNGAQIEGLRIRDDGNVGIGTDNPNDKLVVTGGRLRVDGVNKLSFGNFQGGYADIGVAGGTEGTILFRTYDGSTYQERMRIVNTTGNIGVGNSSPSAKLSIHDGASTTTYFQITNNSTGTNLTDGLNILQSGNNSIFINRENGYMSFETNNTEKMRILSTGEVGIGITTPANTLTVSKTNTGGMGANLALVNLGTGGTSGSSVSIDFGLENSTYTDTQSNAQIKATLEGANNSSSIILSTYNGTTFGERMRILGSGNVGIGTNNPVVKLDVAGGIRGYNLDAASWSNGLGESIALTDGTGILFRTNSTTKMTIRESGNVGIGIDNPSQKLEVVGNTKTQDLILSESSGNTAKATIKYDSVSKSIKFAFA